MENIKDEISEKESEMNTEAYESVSADVIENEHTDESLNNDAAVIENKKAEYRTPMKQSGKNNKEEQKSGLIRRLIYLPLCFISYLLLDLGFRYLYCDSTVLTNWDDKIPFVFSLSWILIFCAVIMFLPRIGKRIFYAMTLLFNIALCITHGIMYNIFQKFFSFADLGFADDGFAFLEKEYIHFPNEVLYLFGTVLAIGILTFILFPKERFGIIKPIASVLILALGIGGIFYATDMIPQNEEKEIAWDSYYDENALHAIYDSFDNPMQSFYLTGLYQYTFRNIGKASGLYDMFVYSDNYEIIETFTSEKETSDNEYTDLCKGKNLIMIQLEAIDSWMITPEYTPNLYKVMSESLNFTNYFSSIFISGGTFNAEFTANTGLIPSSGTVSQSVYTKNTFSYSMANLFRNASYTANSYHGSEADVYNRGEIHGNFGFEKYYSGTDMKMTNYQMDRYLTDAYDMYVSDEPFFSFIITFSGHGPYNDESLNTSEHIDTAKAAVEATLQYNVEGKDLQNFYYAIAHAMETDMFVGSLFEKLEADGHINDTVVIFYTDHYNYYYGNDSKIVEFKGVQDTVMAQRVPFFIYSKGTQPRTIEKAVSGIDILPTVVNLFGLDADMSVFIGDDALGETGGVVPFKGYSWYDGITYYVPGVTTGDAETIGKNNKEVYDKINVSMSMLKSDYYKRFVEE